MIIDTVFDASTKSAPAGFFTAVNAAVEFWERNLINPITVKITFGYNSVDGITIGSNALAESETEGISATYAQVKAGLIKAATSANDHTSVAHLPLNDPTGGAGYFVPAAEAEVLGLAPTFGLPPEGFAGLSSAFPFTFNPNDRSAPGDYDAIGAMEHEISEVLGRIAGSGTVEGGSPDFSPLDLFRYVSAGHLAVTPSVATFSIDGTHLLSPYSFNNPASGDDAGDWGPGVSGDSFGFGSQDQAGLVSPTDLEVMDVLGYKLAADPTASSDFNADGQSDFLIRNSDGVVDVGEVFGGKASYTSPATIGSTVTIEAHGDFLHTGGDQYLTETAAGALADTRILNHSAVVTQLGSIGAGWNFLGAGDFLGLADGDQFLIRNAAGQLDIGNVTNGKVVYTAVGTLASAFTFHGVGDFLGDGQSDFLIQNAASGQVDVGEIKGGHVAFTQITPLALTWKLVGTGDFLGDGKDQFLVENPSGVLDIGEFTGGKTVFTSIATIATTWKFVGTGDYLADGHDQFLIQNAAGVIDVGNWASHEFHLTQVGSLGTQWSFQNGSGGPGAASAAGPASVHSAATPSPSAAGFAQAIGAFPAEPFGLFAAHPGSSAAFVSVAAHAPIATSRP